MCVTPALRPSDSLAMNKDATRVPSGRAGVCPARNGQDSPGCKSLALVCLSRERSCHGKRPTANPIFSDASSGPCRERL